MFPSLLSAPFFHVSRFPHLHKGVMILPSLYGLFGSLWMQSALQDPDSLTMVQRKPPEALVKSEIWPAMFIQLEGMT